MKTSVTLNDQKLSLARSLGNASTIKVLLDKALDSYISHARTRRREMADLLGTDFFEGDLDLLRERKKSVSR